MEASWGPKCSSQNDCWSEEIWAHHPDPGKPALVTSLHPFKVLFLTHKSLRTVWDLITCLEYILPSFTAHLTKSSQTMCLWILMSRKQQPEARSCGTCCHRNYTRYNPSPPPFESNCKLSFSRKSLQRFSSIGWMSGGGTKALLCQFLAAFLTPSPQSLYSGICFMILALLALHGPE